jgi:hypothetical protein
VRLSQGLLLLLLLISELLAEVSVGCAALALPLNESFALELVLKFWLNLEDVVVLCVRRV